MAKERCIELLQEAINLLDASSKWADKAFLPALRLGLRGEKRRERYAARKEHSLKQHFQSLAYDLFDIELYPHESRVDFPMTPDITAWYEVLIRKLWETHSQLSKIANDLVVSGYKAISEPLYEYLGCIQDELIEAKILLKGYLLANKEYHHISRYEISGDDNIHDRYEKKEEKTGYKY